MSDQESNEESVRWRQLLEQVAAGTLSPTDALREGVPGTASKGAKVEGPLDLDLDRRSRCGFPEAIYGPGKSNAVIIDAFRRLHEHGDHCLATRVTPEQAAAVQAEFPDVIHDSLARTLRWMQPNAPAGQTGIAIVTAGTTDEAVAAEAAETLRWMDYEPDMMFDAGVAGPQRLLRRVERLKKAKVVIVAAGMEGALPSVVGGWVACPVIAVPTSVGYGAAFGGLAALLGMLNSCASNVCVVNIDAGFKAGFLAGLMAKPVEG